MHGAHLEESDDLSDAFGRSNHNARPGFAETSLLSGLGLDAEDEQNQVGALVVLNNQGSTQSGWHTEVGDGWC